MLKYLLIFITISIQFVNAGPSSGSPSAHSGQPMSDKSKIAATLISKQKNKFPMILNELKTQNKKTSHWIWWVFPTEQPGKGEPKPKTHIELEMADEILQNAPMDSWSEILETIFQLLKNNPIGTWKEEGQNLPNIKIIQKIDHGRIKFALDFWLDKAREKAMTNARFLAALENLRKFDWKPKMPQR